MTTVSRPANRLPTATALSGITSKLQKILLVEVPVFLANSAAAVALIIATYGMATEDHFTSTTLVSGYLASGIPAALFAAAAALTACVAVRTWKMLDAASRGDVAALTRLSSPGWAVIAMIASWVIPGRMLQQVNGAVARFRAGCAEAAVRGGAPTAEGQRAALYNGCCGFLTGCGWPC